MALAGKQSSVTMKRCIVLARYMGLARSLGIWLARSLGLQRALARQLGLQRALARQLGLQRALARQLGLQRALARQLGLQRALARQLRRPVESSSQVARPVKSSSQACKELDTVYVALTVCFLIQEKPMGGQHQSSPLSESSLLQLHVHARVITSIQACSILGLSAKPGIQGMSSAILGLSKFQVCA